MREVQTINGAALTLGEKVAASPALLFSAGREGQNFIEVKKIKFFNLHPSACSFWSSVFAFHCKARCRCFQDKQFIGTFVDRKRHVDIVAVANSIATGTTRAFQATVHAGGSTSARISPSSSSDSPLAVPYTRLFNTRYYSSVHVLRAHMSCFTILHYNQSVSFIFFRWLIYSTILWNNKVIQSNKISKLV